MKLVYLLLWTQRWLKNNDDKENNLNQTHCKTIKTIHIVNVISHCGDNKHKEIQEVKNTIDPIMSGTEQAGDFLLIL